MTDQPQDSTPQDATPAPQAPAGVDNMSSGDDHRIPKARFDEVNRERNELKARLDQLEQAEQERKQAEMSELEKAQAKATELEGQMEQLNAQYAQVEKARREDRRDNALAQSLASAGAIDADELVLILKAKQADEVNALMADDGTLDSDAIKALVDSTKAARAHNFQSSGVGSPSNRGGAVPVPESEDANRMAKQAAEYGYKVDPRKLAERMQNQDQ